MGKDVLSSIVLDANVLINFINVEMDELLFALPHHLFFATNVVRTELIRPNQAAALEAALRAGSLHELTVPATDPVYAALRVRLDDGESSAMAAAIAHGFAFATDERAAKKVAARDYATLDVVDTPDLVVEMIRADLLSVTEADAMKHVWETRYRFALRIGSFRELLG
ncbi:MAG: hypothetical protein R3E97_00010 [Candidatus Eisenbacteria bacterium]